MADTPKTAKACSFCAKPVEEVAVLIAAFEVSICEKCVIECLGVLQERAVEAVKIFRVPEAEPKGEAGAE